MNGTKKYGAYTGIHWHACTLKTSHLEVRGGVGHLDFCFVHFSTNAGKQWSRPAPQQTRKTGEQQLRSNHCSSNQEQHQDSTKLRKYVSAIEYVHVTFGSVRNHGEDDRTRRCCLSNLFRKQQDKHPHTVKTIPCFRRIQLAVASGL